MKLMHAPHFHIHWSSTDALDWQRFSTCEEASQRAQELVRPDETFTIEEYSTDCPFCNQYKLSATA